MEYFVYDSVIIFYKYNTVISVEKCDKCEADHSTPASAEVKKTWIYTSTPPYAFMA
jgi:hypothetical protein